jgi:hypothetical protein
MRSLPFCPRSGEQDEAMTQVSSTPVNRLAFGWLLIDRIFAFRWRIGSEADGAGGFGRKQDLFGAKPSTAYRSERPWPPN